ncbi:MAG: hypothetical protein ACOX4W_01235 [Bacilli bacterium]
MKKYLYLLLPTLFLSFFTLLVACSKVDNLELSIMPQSYFIVEEKYQGQDFELEIFANLDKSFFSDIVQIDEVYLKDKDESNVVKLDLKSITKADSKIKIGAKKYHIFIFSFFINTNINSPEPLEIKEALISLEYFNDETLELEIGNFTYTRVSHIGTSDNDVSVNHILGLKNTINQIDTLAGVEIRIENRSSTVIKLNSVESFDKNISFSLRNIVSPSSIDSPRKNVEEILNKKYDFFIKENPLILDYYISPNEIFSFFVPIKYEKLYKTNKLPFKICFEKQGVNKEIIFDNFLFFRDFSLSTSEKSMIERYFYDFN